MMAVRCAFQIQPVRSRFGRTGEGCRQGLHLRDGDGHAEAESKLVGKRHYELHGSAADVVLASPTGKRGKEHRVVLLLERAHPSVSPAKVEPEAKESCNNVADVQEGVKTIDLQEAFNWNRTGKEAETKEGGGRIIYFICQSRPNQYSLLPFIKFCLRFSDWTLPTWFRKHLVCHQIWSIWTLIKTLSSASGGKARIVSMLITPFMLDAQPTVASTN